MPQLQYWLKEETYNRLMKVKRETETVSKASARLIEERLAEMDGQMMTIKGSTIIRSDK